MRKQKREKDRRIAHQGKVLILLLCSLLVIPLLWSASVPARAAAGDVTFVSDSEYSVWLRGGDFPQESVNLNHTRELGKIEFELEFKRYAKDGWTDYVTMDVSNENGPVISNVSINTDNIAAGIKLGTDRMTVIYTFPEDWAQHTYTMSFHVDYSQMRKLSVIEEISGPGYQVHLVKGADPWYSSSEVIEAKLEIMPDYNQSWSTFDIEAADKYRAVVTYPEAAPQEGSSCMVDFYIERTLEGDYDPVVNITVTGITLNPGAQVPSEPVPDSEPEPPPVRVENSVNVPGLSSDTILWPLGTYKDGYISYTTITDRELDALIDMANDHSGDAEGMDGDGYKEGIIYVDKKQSYHGKEAMTYRVTFTEKQFDKLAEVDWDRLTVLTPIGRFSIYEDAIRQTAETGSGDVAFRLQKIDHDGRPGLDVSLQVDREHITQFNKPYGTRIFIPYELQEGEDPNAIVMEYIHSDGTKEIVTECHYDSEAGGVYFFSSHLSKFGVSYRPSAFKDVGPKHWANPYVTFLASRGVINGGGGGTFRPDAPATRAEFIHVLANSLSAAQLPKRPIQVYTDVSTGHFAARAADWVYFNNLDGVMTRGGSFYPSEAITRQDAATLVNNAANGSNMRIRSKGKDSAFGDLSSIADYARQPVQRLAQADILKMNESHKFFPTKTMNRGEMAQIIATLLSSL